jgi:hypothetical protein
MREVPERFSIFELPNWWDFRATLQPARKPRWGGYPDEEEEEGEGAGENLNCLVCWKPNKHPFEMPCDIRHTICIGCLNRLRAEDKNRCPICRLPLYRMQTDERCPYNIIITCICITCVFNIIVAALKSYRGCYLQQPLATLLIAPVFIAKWLYFRPPHTLDEEFIAAWRALGLWALCLVIRAYSAGTGLGVWDQVTYIDGELMGELKIEMGYTFVWQR